jgi:hypothetical protein
MFKKLGQLVIKVILAYAVIWLLFNFFPIGASAAEHKPTQGHKPTVIEQKLTAAKAWAIGFGADFKQQSIKNWTETKDALHKDWSWSEGGRFTYPIKNAWEDAVAQVRKDSVTVKGYWQSIADALSGLAHKKQ